jgi:hypothetical protein
VLLVERDGDLLQHASYVNQARVHRGYHYPRSILTALRSSVNFGRFVEDFDDCIDCSFRMYYALGRRFSKVTAAQFRLFCQRIGAPVRAVPKEIRKMFNPDLIEDVFEVEEYAFDTVRLKNLILRRLADADVEIALNTSAVSVRAGDDGALALRLRNGDGELELRTDRLLTCSYSQMNELLVNSSLPRLALKHEIAEIALVEPPAAVRELGITVMCGPFFSTMPFPPRGLHSFTHVRYTPHTEWHDWRGEYHSPQDTLERFPRKSNFIYMLKDAQRYMPILAGTRYVDSLWEVKTATMVCPTSRASWAAKSITSMTCSTH